MTTLINKEKIKKETSLIEVSLENKTVEEGETYSQPHSDCVCTYAPVDGNAGGIVVAFRNYRFLLSNQRCL